MKENLYNLTAPQKSILLTEEYYKGTSINNICGTAIIEDKIDFDLLKKAFSIFVKNNDSFNLKLVLDNNQVKQYLGELNDIDVEVIDIDSKDEISKIENDLMSHVFDIYNSDLFCFKIFRLKDNTGGFIANVHHLFADSWTLGLLAKEIVKIYSCLANGENVDKNDDFSYVKYIYSEQEYFNSDKFKKDKEYWNNIFDTIPEQASIPGSRTNSSNDFSCKANRHVFNINASTMEKINEFCKKNHASAFNFFMAVYSIYISRVSGLEDFVIGTPILNRTNFNEKNTTGMFINTAPLRVCVNNEIDFKSFVSNIAKDSLGMLRHQKYYYQTILEDLRKKDSSLPNLYNILISYQVTKANTEKGLTYNTRWNFNGNTADDIDIHLYDLNDSGALNIAYDYKTSKYEDSDIIAIHNRIMHIVNQILSCNDINVSNIEIVTSKEKYDILYKWNDTDADYPKDKTVIDLFEEQVEKTPDNIALCFNDDFLNYKNLNEKANQLAHFLVSLGIKNGDVVAIRLNKSLEMIIGILAIMKAGACYLPIDLSYPQERVSFMLKDSNAKLFLTNALHKDDLEISISSILIDLSNEEIYTGNTQNLNIAIKPEDSIYIIYTSGSTGTPKGVELMHRNIVRLLKNDHFLFDFSDKDIWTMFHSCAFDFSVWEMYGALLYGGKLILVPELIAKDPSKFLDLLRKEKVTVLNQTPTYFYNLSDMELLKDDDNLCIRYIIFGGEALNPKFLQEWHIKYPSTRLINMYGITETTVHVTFRELSGTDLLTTSSNIGTPIPTLKVYVMDKNQRLMPYGVEGEMCVAGLGLCKGYLNRPELNSTRFVQNPYVPGELLYRSADSAILSDDGVLFYKGRIDNQVKIRGFRVELGEIESKLRAHSCVDKCIVLPKNVDNKDSFLVAYLICNRPTTDNELKSYISKLVPTYMIPTYFVFMDSFPLTNNGKIDRKNMLNMDITLTKSISYVEPRNDFESTFAKVLEDTLGIKNVGIDDNILELGADSLTLMKVTVELLQKNYTVNIQDIYELKTIRLISDKLDYRNKINKILSDKIYYNFDEKFTNIKFNFNNVLLTGSTGYLGIHLLYDLLVNTSATIYCLIRKKNGVEPKYRLMKKLEFYFGKDILKFIDNRIKVIDGDIALDNLGLDSSSYNELGKVIDVVVHCAAVVSHYGNKELFNTINVVGTNHIIDFCMNFDIKLNHISTTSVCAYHIDSIDSCVPFDEHCLYIGQSYEDNIYIKTKFEAECNIYEAINSGLNATVYRLGNITARFIDGKFQENENENAFLNRIISFVKLEKIADSFANISIDLSPVDICSNLIINMLGYESSYGKVFHICNNNVITVKNLIEFLNKLGKHIDIVSDSEFNSFISNLTVKDDALGIINDITSNFSGFNNNIDLKSNFTINYMKNLNLVWPSIDLNYLEKFLRKYIKEGI